MKLFPRLLLLGAALPAAVASAMFAAGIGAMTSALDNDLNQALLSQAAVESVSLFDGPRGLHLHMASSPILEAVRPFAPEAAVYDQHGQQLLTYPPHARLPQVLDHVPAGTELTTTTDGMARRLLISVRNPQTGKDLALMLSGSRRGLLATQARFKRFAVVGVVGLVAVLGALCFAWATRLSSRVGRLEAHMRRLAAGDVDGVPIDDGGDDEITALHSAVVAATVEIAASRQSRERFIAEAAHELRTPLASMQVALELALRRYVRGEDEPPSVQRIDDLVAALREAHEETGRLAHLAHGLLDVTAARSALWQLGRVNLGGLVDDVVDAATTRAADAGVVVRVTATDASTDIVGHATALRRVFENLIDNAIKHAATGISIALTSSDDHVDIVIDDDGVGVPAEAVATIFEPFHRVDQDRRGVGLGLAVVREIVQRHHGEAWAQPGPGGHFCVRLPKRALNGPALMQPPSAMTTTSEMTS